MSRKVGATIFVKTVREDDGYTRFYALDIPTYTEPERYDWLYLTAWPLPSSGMPIGSSGPEWPDSLRVVRKAKELRECAQMYQRSLDRIPRMMFVCKRNADGTITVSNSVNFLSGQVHTHTPEDFDRWRANAVETGAEERDFVWVS